MKRLILASFMLFATVGAEAQQAGFTRPSGPVQPASARLQAEVGYQPKLGQSLPLDAILTDETGASLPLSSYFAGASAKRPVLLVFYYQSCPMLCSLQLESVVASLKGTRYVVGRDFAFLAISMDPNDTVEGSAKAKRKITNAYGQSGSESGFHFLTGTAENIKRITAAAGYRYYWDEESKQWAHATGVLLLAPDGRMARYLPGIEPFPRDLQFALIEASEGQIGTIVDRVVLYCYQYNEASGRYGASIMRTLRLSALGTIIVLAGFVVFSLRRERKAASSHTHA
ncbi:MAG: SCO family protein [Vicinamibacteria bacterium]